MLFTRFERVQKSISNIPALSNPSSMGLQRTRFRSQQVRFVSLPSPKKPPTATRIVDIVVQFFTSLRTLKE